MKEKDPDGILGFEKGLQVDFAKFQERKIDDLTDCPAPNIPGLYSLQAIARNKEEADVTVYGRHVKQVLEWSSQVSRKDRVSCFLLRDANKEHWSVYEVDGLLSGFCKRSADHCTGESDRIISVSKGQFTEEAREMVGDENLSLLACFEEHAGASAADHSNFSVIMCRMIAEASPSDLQRIYIVESKRWPCRVQGVFANVSKLSPERQDVYLDRFKWINKEWPLVTAHHLDTLAKSLSTTRREYVRELLRASGRAAGMCTEIQLSLVTEWELASPESKKRFARHIVEVLKGGLLFYKGAPELFALDYVESHGGEVVADYRRRFWESGRASTWASF